MRLIHCNKNTEHSSKENEDPPLRLYCKKRNVTLNDFAKGKDMYYICTAGRYGKTEYLYLRVREESEGRKGVKRGKEERGGNKGVKFKPEIPAESDGVIESISWPKQNQVRSQSDVPDNMAPQRKAKRAVGGPATSLPANRLSRGATKMT